MKDVMERIGQIEAVVMEEVDPVDWTLAESYMEMALNDFISSMALLISPLLPEDYEMQNTVMVKSLTRNTNILFTPVEKFASYPISSQPMQLLLQSYLKGMWTCLLQKSILKAISSGNSMQFLDKSTER